MNQTYKPLITQINSDVLDMEHNDDDDHSTTITKDDNSLVNPDDDDDQISSRDSKLNELWQSTKDLLEFYDTINMEMKEDVMEEAMDQTYQAKCKEKMQQEQTCLKQLKDQIEMSQNLELLITSQMEKGMIGDTKELMEEQLPESSNVYMM